MSAGLHVERGFIICDKLSAFLVPTYEGGKEVVPLSPLSPPSPLPLHGLTLGAPLSLKRRRRPHI